MSKYVARFWEYVERGSEDECWPWLGVTKPDHYGFFTVRDPRKRTVYAHRHAYELLVGPIPVGLHIDHLCRNPSCVNPAHMEPVTQGENSRRRRGSTSVATVTRATRSRPKTPTSPRAAFSPAGGVTATHSGATSNGGQRSVSTNRSARRRPS